MTSLGGHVSPKRGRAGVSLRQPHGSDWRLPLRDHGCARTHRNTPARDHACTRARTHARAHGALDGHTAAAGASCAGHRAPGGGGVPRLLGDSSKFRRSPGHAAPRNPAAQPVAAAGRIRVPLSFPPGPSWSPSTRSGSAVPVAPRFPAARGKQPAPHVLSLRRFLPSPLCQPESGAGGHPRVTSGVSCPPCPARHVLPAVSYHRALPPCPAHRVLPAASPQPDPPAPPQQLDGSCTLGRGSGWARTVREGKPSSPRVCGSPRCWMAAPAPGSPGGAPAGSEALTGASTSSGPFKDGNCSPRVGSWTLPQAGGPPWGDLGTGALVPPCPAATCRRGMHQPREEPGNLTGAWLPRGALLLQSRPLRAGFRPHTPLGGPRYRRPHLALPGARAKLSGATPERGELVLHGRRGAGCGTEGNPAGGALPGPAGPNRRLRRARRAPRWHVAARHPSLPPAAGCLARRPLAEPRAPRGSLPHAEPTASRESHARSRRSTEI